MLTFLSSACKTCTQTLLLLLVYLTIQISANLIGQIIGRTSCCGNYPQSEALISHLYKTFFTLATKKMKVASMCCGYFYPYDRSWEIIVVSQTAIAHIIDSRTIGCCYFFLHIFFFSGIINQHTVWSPLSLIMPRLCGCEDGNRFHQPWCWAYELMN